MALTLLVLSVHIECTTLKWPTIPIWRDFGHVSSSAEGITLLRRLHAIGSSQVPY